MLLRALVQTDQFLLELCGGADRDSRLGSVPGALRAMVLRPANESLGKLRVASTSRSRRGAPAAASDVKLTSRNLQPA
jgi:hypothetical protein